MRYFTTLLILFLALPSWADSLRVDHAHIPAAPPTAPVLTAYMTLENTGENDVSVIAFDSPHFKRIEMHESRMEDGVARMRAVKSIDIAAGAQIALEAGGLHLMMFEPSAPLSMGDSVELNMTFANGRQQSTTATVKARQTQHHHNHSHHH